MSLRRARQFQGIFIAIFGVIGGLLSRFHGSASGPKVLKSCLFALPLTLVIFWLYADYSPSWVGYTASGLCFGMAAAMKSKGHGGGIDAGHSAKEPGHGRDAEDIELPILWLNGKISPGWYDFILMEIKGLLVAAGPSLALGYLDIGAGLLALSGGLWNATAYRLGWARYPTGSGTGFLWFTEATQIAEFLGGLYTYASFAAGAFVVASNYGLI